MRRFTVLCWEVRLGTPSVCPMKAYRRREQPECSVHPTGTASSAGGGWSQMTRSMPHLLPRLLHGVLERKVRHS